MHSKKYFLPNLISRVTEAMLELAKPSFVTKILSKNMKSNGKNLIIMSLGDVLSSVFFIMIEFATSV